MGDLTLYDNRRQTTVPDSAPAALSRARLLSRKQKAAIIVRLLLNEGADVPLQSLPESMQEEVVQIIGSMKYVDRATLADVVMEFARELDSIGLAFPDGLAGALSALDGRLSPRTAARLRKEAGVRQKGDPWERLRALEVPELAAIAEAEAVEVAAVLLSKLDTPKAAELLAALPGATARRIAYAVSVTTAVTPEAVDRIGLSLAAQLDNRPERAFSGEAGKRMGEILNFSPAMTRDEVLEGLEAEDAEFAEAVRKVIFTFAHIPERVQSRDIPKAIRSVDQADLILALAAAQAAGLGNVAEFILDGMSKRLAESVREAMTETTPPRGAAAEAAMNRIAGAVRDMVAAGEIELHSPGDAED